MVRIRLRRTGKKKQPSYRVVVADSESPRDGRFIENIGVYNPRTDPATVEINEERALYWLSQGAQPSDAVARLLRNMGTLAKFEAMKSGQAVAETAVEPEAEVAAEDETEVEAAAEDETEVEAAAEDETEVEAAAEDETEAEAAAEDETEAEPESEPTADSE
jgi:small subunit ribosomal protein S16